MAEPVEGESRRVWIFAALLTTGGWALTAAYALYSYLHRIADGYVSPLPRCPHDGFGMGVIFRGSRIRAECVGFGFLSDPRLRPLEGVNLKEIDAHHLAFLSADFPVAHPNAHESVLWNQEHIPIAGIMRRVGGSEDTDVWIYCGDLFE